MRKLAKVLRRPGVALRRVCSMIWNRVCFAKEGIECKAFPRIDGFPLIMRSAQGRICIGKGVKMNSGRKCNPVGYESRMMLTAAKGAVITIGDQVGMSNTVMYAAKSITIEDHVMLGNGVKIYDTDFHSLDAQQRKADGREQGIAVKPVRICEGAFIGAGTLILKGVTIGKESVVGAGSVVTKDIPEREIWAGNPARMIRKL